MKPDKSNLYYDLLSLPSYYQEKSDDFPKYRNEFWETYDLEKAIVTQERVDQFGFVLVFKHLKEEKKIHSFLEQLYSDYEGDPLEWLNYTFDWISNRKKNFEGWQIIIIEKWLTDKIDIISKRPGLKLKESNTSSSLTLKEMFSNPEELNHITNQLIKKTFVKDGVWQGKPDPITGRNPKEKLLAALALVIEERNFLKKKHYQAKQMHKAFNGHFNISTGGRYFKPGQKLELEEYKRLFYFI